MYLRHCVGTKRELFRFGRAAGRPAFAIPRIKRQRGDPQRGGSETRSRLVRLVNPRRAGAVRPFSPSFATCACAADPELFVAVAD
jgi:hypothetical protein